MEPSYLVTIGAVGAAVFAAVAVAGLAWGYFRMRAASPSMTPMASPATTPTVRPEPLPAPPAPGVPPAPPRQLSSNEVEKKVRVIDRLLEILSKDMEPTIVDGPRLLAGAWNAFKNPLGNPKYVNELRAYRDLVKQNAEKLDALRDQSPEYQDIVGATVQTYYNSAFPAIEDFYVTYGRFATYLSKDIENSSFENLMKPKSYAFAKAIQDFAQWRHSTRGRVIEIRRQISP